MGLGLLLAFLPAVPGSAGAIPSNAPDPGAYVTNGPVNAIAHAPGRTYIGGDFTRVGRRSGSGAVLDSQGAPQSFPEVAGGHVNTAISDGDGGWFIGGTFTAVGGERHVGLAHVWRDGSVDSGFNPVVTDSNGDPAIVNALLLAPEEHDGSRVLYVGGEFSLIGLGTGQPHRNIAALNARDGRGILEFAVATDCASGKSQGCSPAVHALALAHIELPVTDPVTETVSTPPQPVLFFGGTFSAVGPADPVPSSVKGMAAVWGIGSVDATKIPNAGQLVASGASTYWLPSLTNVGDTNSQVGAGVYALEAGPPTPHATNPALAVYIGGWNRPTTTSSVTPMVRAWQFRISDRTSRTVFSAGEFLQTGTNRWVPQPPTCADCAMRALALDDSQLYFGGDTVAEGSATGYLAKIAKISNADSTNAPANRADGALLGGGLDGPVRALTRSAATLIAGGDFGEGVLALDSSSGEPSPAWTSPSPDSSVRALATDPSTSSVYAGGAFRALGSVPRRGLAAFDSSGALLDWAPGVVGGPDAAPRVHALAASSSAVYVGGQFADAVGSADSGPGTPPAHANLAAFDAASGNLVDAFRPAPSLTGDTADVLSLALLDSTLYVGGAFDQLGAQPRENLAAVDGSSGAVLGWDPRVEGREVGVEPAVHAILPACGAVYVGGRFDRVGGQTRANIAALQSAPAGGAATSWNPGAEGAVLALARSASTIYAGGTFPRIAGQSRNRVAGLDVASGGATAFNPGIRTLGASVHALAVSDSAVYMGGVFDNVRDQPALNLAAADPGSGEPAGWSPGADGRVEALAVGDGGVYAGGRFESVGATGQRGFAPFGAGAGSPFASAACGSASTASQPEPVSTTTVAAAPESSAPVTVTTRSARPGVGPLTVSPKRVSLRRGVLVVRFRLSRSMSVRLRFERRVRGRCAARRGGGRSRRVCWRYVRFVQLTRRGGRGLNRVSFSRRRIGGPRRGVGGRRLVPGRYRVTLIAPETGRAASKRVAHFRVVRR